MLRIGVIACITAALAFGQADTDKGTKKAAAGGGGTTLTGCLTKGEAAGEYTLSVKGGRKFKVTGTGDLEKHAANHTVKLTGTRKASMFEATGVQHVSGTCAIGGSGTAKAKPPAGD